jgi:hypothetical protein
LQRPDPSAATKRKPLPPHWYLIYVRECPVCASTKVERIRQFTPRPEDALNRVEYVPTYDWCQG